MEDGRSEYVQVGVRARAGEGGDGGVVDGDDVVGVNVVVAARADTGSVVGGCALWVDVSTNGESREDKSVVVRTITSRLGHLDLCEGGRGSGESDEESGGGEAHVERRGNKDRKKLTSKRMGMKKECEWRTRRP